MRTIIFLILFAYACHGQSEIGKTPSCEDDLKKFLASNWKLEKDSGYYLHNVSFYHNLDSNYGGCLKKLNADKIRTLFGLPTNSKKERYEYRVGPCLPNNCWSYVFYFDAQDRFVKLDSWTTITTQD
jgi:hypothetical protein